LLHRMSSFVLATLSRPPCPVDVWSIRTGHTPHQEKPFPGGLAGRPHPMVRMKFGVARL
jgi:hypothetical protein